MGDVYLATQFGPAGIAKMVVVKHLRGDFASSESARTMFLNEARIAMRLNHPGVVQTFEVVEEEEDLYLVMEFLDGQSLSQILKPNHTEAFPLSAKLAILVKALEGLHYVHELKGYDGTAIGAVHRDVSPQNIIVTYNGHVKLVDFGVAKVADATNVTASGVFKGKVRYASPEQVLCATVDRRADLYGIGTILWEMLAGKRMWHAHHGDASIFLALASGQFPSIREACPEIPAALEAICARALAKDVSARYATALEFRADLLQFLADSQAPAPELASAMLSTFAAERLRLHTRMDSLLKATREAATGTITVRPGSTNRSAIPPSENSLSLSRGAPAIELASQVGEFPRRSKAQKLAAFAVLGGAILVVSAIAIYKPLTGGAAPAGAESRVHLALKASPPSARFLLDGTPLPTNPYEGDVARDDATHHLSVHADGFETREVDTSFSSDVRLEEALPSQATIPSVAVSDLPRARQPQSGTVPVANRAQAAPSRGSDLDRAPTRGPQRPIDEDDPYK
jgi:serine/threonine protein kinase